MGRTLTPHGKVIQGDYLGLNVYVWESNKMLKLIDGVVVQGFFSNSYTEKATIDATTVDRFQLVSTSKESGASDTLVGAAYLFAGKGVANTLSNSVMVNKYNVAIYFKNGKKCVVELNDHAYNTLNTACFVL